MTDDESGEDDALDTTQLKDTPDANGPEGSVQEPGIQPLAADRVEKIVAAAHTLGARDPHAQLVAADTLAGVSSMAELARAADEVAVLAEDLNPEVRWAAMYASGKVGARGCKSAHYNAVRLLAEGADDLMHRATVRAVGISAPRQDGLHDGGFAAAIAGVSGELEHRDPKVRRAAIRTLSGMGGVGEGKDLRTIGRRLLDADPEVRQAACEFLARFAQPGDPTATEALATCLKDPDRFVQCDAIRAVAARLKNRDPFVRRVAAEALRASAPPVDTGASRALALRLQDADATVRAAAVVVAGWWAADADRKACAELAKRLKDDDRQVRCEALEALARRLSGDDPAAKRVASWACRKVLGNQGGAAMETEGLRLRDPDFDVQWHAVNAMSEVLGRAHGGDAESVESAARRLRGADGDPRAREPPKPMLFVPLPDSLLA